MKHKSPSDTRSTKNPQKTRRRRTRFAVVAALFVSVAFAGTFALPRNTSQASQKKYRATKQIIRDEATGQRRLPTDAEVTELVDQIGALTNRSEEGLVVQERANGVQAIDLQGRFGGVTLGRASEDGTMETRCVFSLEEAEDFLGLEENSAQ